MGMAIVREESSRKKFKNSAQNFSEEFVTNPFSTTRRALAHEGAETQKWKKERGNDNKKEAKLRSKAPGQRVSMRSV